MISPSLAAWEIPERAYSIGETSGEKLRFAIRYAVLAPSVHNSQPWLFRMTNSGLELWADWTRALPVVDPHGRELVISCGAALFNLRIALRHFGCVGEIRAFPADGVDELLAAIRVGTSWEPNQEEDLLFRAILKRHTNRRPFEDRDIPPSLVLELQEAAEQEGAWLHVVEGAADREALADLVSAADRAQAADFRFRRELAHWIVPSRTKRLDGIPGYALGYGRLQSYVAPLLVRTFDFGEAQAARDRQLLLDSPAVAVLGTNADTRRSWFAAGQALERVLLRSRAEGVWTSFLNQPIEVTELRTKVRDLLGRSGFPQIVIRMGYDSEAPATPRRPVNEVVV